MLSDEPIRGRVQERVQPGHDLVGLAGVGQQVSGQSGLASVEGGDRHVGRRCHQGLESPELRQVAVLDGECQRGHFDRDGGSAGRGQCLEVDHDVGVPGHIGVVEEIAGG
ncbi:hypothetical protein ACGFNP_52450 [Nonomuraea sp. NPDC049269]|uniref:hypothetical protein n=1 Tax=Nonomuraea sp. NPDC049269 TaxID=3364349 RepID=UPI0037206F48